MHSEENHSEADPNQCHHLAKACGAKERNRHGKEKASKEKERRCVNRAIIDPHIQVERTVSLHKDLIS